MGGRRAAGNNDLQKLATAHNWQALQIKGAIANLARVCANLGFKASAQYILDLGEGLLEENKRAYQYNKRQLEAKNE